MTGKIYVYYLVSKAGKKFGCVALNVDGMALYRGVSFCSPEDQFNRRIGRGLAMKRLELARKLGAGTLTPGHFGEAPIWSHKAEFDGRSPDALGYYNTILARFELKLLSHNPTSYKEADTTLSEAPLQDKLPVLSEDRVNHPGHYTQHPSGVECITITQHHNFCVGNAIKYLWRNGLKKSADMTDQAKQLEDLHKAVWYIQQEIRRLGGSNDQDMFSDSYFRGLRPDQVIALAKKSIRLSKELDDYAAEACNAELIINSILADYFDVKGKVCDAALEKRIKSALNNMYNISCPV